MRFDGKTALVTGASRGMGAATAQMLSDRGARVFTAQRGPAGFEDIAADLSDPNAASTIIEAVRKQSEALDILVNNAGIMREGALDEMVTQDWHDQIQVNLTTPAMLIRAALPMLRKSKGAIVNLGSIEGLGSNPRHPAYAASKAGLHGLTRAVAVDHGSDGIRCNAVAPGWIDTELNEDFIASFADPTAFRAEIGAIHPLRRTGKPEEVAELICWLASDAASFVTGQIWTIDGGRMAQLSLP
ncbi:MAG: SDR family NAD(P)-dependent oxidoreductase [Pseudomonadota bacterium]